MSVHFGPVPAWSAPLPEQVAFFALVLGAVLLVHGARPRSQSKTRDAIIALVFMLIIMGLVAAMHWF